MIWRVSIFFSLFSLHWYPCVYRHECHLDVWEEATWLSVKYRLVCIKRCKGPGLPRSRSNHRWVFRSTESALQCTVLLIFTSFCMFSSQTLPIADLCGKIIEIVSILGFWVGKSVCPSQNCWFIFASLVCQWLSAFAIHETFLPWRRDHHHLPTFWSFINWSVTFFLLFLVVRHRSFRDSCGQPRYACVIFSPGNPCVRSYKKA